MSWYPKTGNTGDDENLDCIKAETFWMTLKTMSSLKRKLSAWVVTSLQEKIIIEFLCCSSCEEICYREGWAGFRVIMLDSVTKTNISPRASSQNLGLGYQKGEQMQHEFSVRGTSEVSEIT